MTLKDCKSILIFVPHQDDEIAVAGALIWKMRKQGKEVYVCYATNGDYEIDADIRYREAREALKVLGVDESHIIMLGYPDTSNEEGKKHLFYFDENIPIHSKAGYEETYGGNLFKDYAWKKNGKHHAYIKENYKNDVKQVITDIMPDFLICVDMDHHVDHRMLSLVFEQAMGEVLKEMPCYCPKIWKAFAYGTNFSGERDYWEVNLKETQFPHTRLLDNKGRMDNPFYDWNKRIRFPVDEELYAFPIEGGKLYQALEKHVSQKAILFAETKINCDEVYWERRTDNLLLHADITASSGKASYLNDFMLFDCREIHEVEYLKMNGMWRPDKEDREKKVSIEFSKETAVQKLSFWGKGKNVWIIVNMEGTKKSLYIRKWLGEAEMLFSAPVNTKNIEVLFSYKEKEEFGVGEMEAFALRNSAYEYTEVLMDNKMLKTYYTPWRYPKSETYVYWENNTGAGKQKKYKDIPEKKGKVCRVGYGEWRHMLQKINLYKITFQKKIKREIAVNYYAK